MVRRRTQFVAFVDCCEGQKRNLMGVAGLTEMATPEINYTCVSALANSLLIHVPPRQPNYNDDQEEKKRRYTVGYLQV